MKTAYELAMERLGGTETVSDTQKTRLAEIDTRYDAKRAEAELRTDEAIKKAGPDIAAVDTLRSELSRDLQRIEAHREEQKQAVRSA